MNPDARIDELEIRYTHLLAQVEELNSELIVCNNRISELERNNALMRRLLTKLQPEKTFSPDE